jgi:hypothetical protein
MSEAKSGRPPTLTDAQIDELLQRITDGDSLLSIVNNGVDWPSYSTVFRRIENDVEFRARYDRARQVQAERWADELVTLSDSLPENATAEQIGAVKLQIDTRKWIISKRLPKVYGDAPTPLNLNTTTNNFLVVSEARQHEIQERTRMLLGGEDNQSK